MFFDIGPLRLVALVVLAVLIFGPDKLPKLIQDAARMIRKVRAFSDNAKADIRSELGPEFKDFEFEDLHPKTFVRKHVLDKDELGIGELRGDFDLKREMADVTDAMHGLGGTDATPSAGARSASAADGSQGPDLLKKRQNLTPGERPPFDADAT